MKEILGDYTDLSEDFPLWIISEASDGATSNYYPDARSDWWFYRGDSTEVIGLEEPPTFHAPEFPLGTISSIAVIALALIGARELSCRVYTSK